MTAIDTTGTDLHWDVLTIKRPGLTRHLPPGKEELMWVANSSTLIYGERDAILVDSFLTTEHSKTLLGWVVARGKNLTAIYITHGHGDHFFGLASLLERFPRAKAVATPEIVRAMREHISPAWIEDFWRRLFPGEIPDRLLVAEPLEGNALELEGHKLVAVNTGRRNAVLQYAARLSGVVEKTFVRGNLVFGRSTAAQPARIGRVMQRGEEI
jgi:glyoxylase-like metal-dependent hydrolase (beta-lactamase superfamily II)